MVSKQSSDLLLLEDVQWYSFLGILETNVSAWSCFSYPGPSLTRWLQVLLMLYWPQICSGELACLLTPGQAARQIYTYILIIALESFPGELTGQESSTNPSLWGRVSFWRLKHSQQCYQENSVFPWLLLLSHSSLPCTASFAFFETKWYTRHKQCISMCTVRICVFSGLDSVYKS